VTSLTRRYRAALRVSLTDQLHHAIDGFFDRQSRCVNNDRILGDCERGSCAGAIQAIALSQGRRDFLNRRRSLS
jgi:hypothetical protein